MRLYLIRHGDALGPEVDPARPLSQRGRNEAERLGAYLGSLSLELSEIWHSNRRVSGAAFGTPRAFPKRLPGGDPSGDRRTLRRPLYRWALAFFAGTLGLPGIGPRRGIPMDDDHLRNDLLREGSDRKVGKKVVRLARWTRTEVDLKTGLPFFRAGSLLPGHCPERISTSCPQRKR